MSIKIVHVHYWFAFNDTPANKGEAKHLDGRITDEILSDNDIVAFDGGIVCGVTTDIPNYEPDGDMTEELRKRIDDAAKNSK